MHPVVVIDGDEVSEPVAVQCAGQAFEIDFLRVVAPILKSRCAERPVDNCMRRQCVAEPGSGVLLGENQGEKDGEDRGALAAALVGAGGRQCVCGCRLFGAWEVTGEVT
jgi:hypothetical protein